MRSSAFNGCYCIVIVTADVWLRAIQKHSRFFIYVYRATRGLLTRTDAEFVGHFVVSLQSIFLNDLQAININTGVLISPWPSQEVNKLQQPNFCKPLKKKIHNVVRPTRSPRQQWPPRRTKNGDISSVFFSRVGLRTYQHPCTGSPPFSTGFRSWTHCRKENGVKWN